MKTKTLLLALLVSATAIAQSYDYNPSPEHPYGKVHPDAPEQVQDFEELIGECHCWSKNRNQDRTWNKPITMVWQWKYIMNGTAVQDETFKEDGIHSGSIRQFHPDSLQWYVHYYSNRLSTSLPTWTGGKDGDILRFVQPQKAPNGMDGISRLTFYDISKEGYKWVGEWVSTDGKYVYPFWKIVCTRNLEAMEELKNEILD